MIRVIPSLLVKNGSMVKGLQGANDRVVGTIDSGLRVQTARNVDEVTLIDVGSRDSIESLSSCVERASRFLRVPFSAGGGVRSLEDISNLLRAGADKVLLGRKAFSQASLVRRASERFGAQAISACVEFEGAEGDWTVTNHPPGQNLGVAGFSQRLQDEGVGEIVLFCKSLDGLKTGAALDQVEEVASLLNVPLTYMGGVGEPNDAVKLADAGASGIAVGALFAFTRFTPNDLKRSLLEAGHEVRL